MKAKEVIAIINETLEKLENNAAKCLKDHDTEHVRMYLDYAVGIRMVLDNIEAGQVRSPERS